MVFLKEDGSLDIEYINKLPLEEHLRVVASLTNKKLKEYVSKNPTDELGLYPRSTYTEKPMEEWGVDAMEFLEKMKEKINICQ